MVLTHVEFMGEMRFWKFMNAQFFYKILRFRFPRTFSPPKMMAKIDPNNEVRFV